MDRIPKREQEPSLRERFRRNVCQFQRQVVFLFVLQIAMLLFALFSFAFIDRDSTSYVILQLDLAILGVTLLMTTSVMYLCRNSIGDAPER